MYRYALARFKALHQWLLHHFPGIELPLLPPTSWRRSFNAQYIEAQRKQLNAYVKSLVTMSECGISSCPAVIAFLTDDDMSGGSFNSGSFPTAHDDDLAPCRGIAGGLHLSLVVEVPRDAYLDDKARLALQGNRCALCKASLQRAGMLGGNARKCWCVRGGLLVSATPPHPSCRAPGVRAYNNSGAVLTDPPLIRSLPPPPGPRLVLRISLSLSQVHAHVLLRRMSREREEHHPGTGAPQLGLFAA